MARLIGTARMNESGATGTITVPKDLVDRFNLDAAGVDVVYLENDDGDVILRRADEVDL